MAELLNGGGDRWFTDVPGHGLSPQPHHDMPDWVAMARRVGDALAENAGGKPVVGIGHSMGGVLTMLLASERPELFSRIILLDPVLFSPEVLLFQRLARKSGLWKRSALVKAVAARRRNWPDASQMKDELAKKSLYRRWQPQALEHFVEGGSRGATEGGVELSCNPHWEASIFGSYPRGLWKAVHSIRVPVDILVATESYGFIARAARKAQKGNANVRWQTVEGGHCFPMEQPELCADLINALLNNDAAFSGSRNV
ncbi:alpha/beta fold hydrolase [Thalassolituus sp. LLYu03]|uniref:alpha/beta fold hydrolase n=1 Tax=Thalassolituus sp. LLYu03 TaxID=3421656 RepID=UPI003D28176F